MPRASDADQQIGLPWREPRSRRTCVKVGATLPVQRKALFEAAQLIAGQPAGVEQRSREPGFNTPLGQGFGRHHESVFVRETEALQRQRAIDGDLRHGSSHGPKH